jgi:cellulose synthase/poly-beta-1,6-N-acetylglucosamine synthase-like glycosyltransferase
METLVLGVGACLAFFTAHYVYFLTRVGLGLFSLSSQRRTDDRPFVSVVIAARNEERHIGDCIAGLLRQEYPKNLYEVIVVDDRSGDSTADIVREIASANPAVRLLSISVAARSTSPGKAAALQVGIAASRGSIIVTTDADCTVPPTWLSTLASYFSPEIAFVSGPVVENPQPTLFSRLEALEFFGLILVGAGLIGANRPIICNGANLAFRRSAFDAVGGYGEGSEANDDEGLMNKIVFRKVGRAAFASAPEALVLTSSNNTPLRFFLQRVRWASKKGRYEDRSILLTLVLLYFFFVSALAAIVAAAWAPLLALPVALVLLGKVIMEYALLRSAGRMYGISIPTLPFLIAQIFHVPYIVSAAAVGQFMRTSWKD